MLPWVKLSVENTQRTELSVASDQLAMGDVMIFDQGYCEYVIFLCD